MSGIGMVLNTAKAAISSNQIGLNVTGHNIANVNTPGYSRQTPVFEAKPPTELSNFTLGTGAEIDRITRSSSALIEKQLIDQKSGLERYESAGSYMAIIENLFNETSETSLGSQISAFWNAWHDLSNMPSGFSERQAVFDVGNELSAQVQWLDDNMLQFEMDLEREVQAGIDRVNTLAEQIAEINTDIVGDLVNDDPNDKLDKRNNLLSEMAELMDLQSYLQPNGSLTVATGTGHVLVYGSDTFKLEMRAGQVNWVDSQNSGIDITDKIKGGKVGGWLEVRDEIIPKYRQDMDAMAEELIWSVNLQHSQGVGLEFLKDPVTGSYQTSHTGAFSTLGFGDRIDYTGDFKMWVKDTTVIPPTYSNIAVDMDVSNVTVNNWAGAAPGQFQYRLTVTTAGTVGPAGTDPVLSWERFNPDGTTTGVSGNVTVTDVNTLVGTVDGLTFNINAGDLYEGNTFTVNTNAAGAAGPLALTATGNANSVNDTYSFRVVTGGVIGTDTIEIEWGGSHTSEIITLDPGALPLNIDVDGMTLQFSGGTLFDGDVFTIATDDTGVPMVESLDDWKWNLSSFATAFNNAADAVVGGGPGSGYVQATITSDYRLTFTQSAGYEFAFSDDQVQDSGLAAALGFNNFFTGDSAGNIAVNSLMGNKEYIAAARIDATTGNYGVGDNQNAIAIAEIQFASFEMNQWTYERDGVDWSRNTNNTIEGYYQGMIGSMGIKAASIERNTNFNQIMVDKITEQRDSISGVNLDEEMINLMKYQHAFAVASKLLTIADEMMQTLIATK